MIIKNILFSFIWLKFLEASRAVKMYTLSISFKSFSDVSFVQLALYYLVASGFCELKVKYILERFNWRLNFKKK